LGKAENQSITIRRIIEMASIIVDSSEPEKVEETAETALDKVEEVSIPDKFQGKTAEEVVASYLELEKRLGTQAQEVGTLRSTVDTLLADKLTRGPATQAKENVNESSLEFDDLVEDPAKVINAQIDRKLTEVNERFDKQESEQGFNQFVSNNPDYEEISGSEDFYAWANTSPYRQRLLNDAQNGDFSAASDILSAFRETRTEMIDAAKEGASLKRSSDLAAASSVVSGTGEKSVKTFSREELMRLRRSDPGEYARIQAEVIEAYKDGRIT
jgi:hypothetical protein